MTKIIKKEERRARTELVTTAPFLATAKALPPAEVEDRRLENRRRERRQGKSPRPSRGKQGFDLREREDGGSREQKLAVRSESIDY